MGSNASKTASSVAKTAAKAAPRKYPTRPPPPSNQAHASKPIAKERVDPSASRPPAESRDRGVEFDASDPDFGLAARLSQLGPVQPNPTQSNSSTFNRASASPSHQSSSTAFQPSASTPSQSIFPNAKQNPAVSLLTARYRLAEEAEREFNEIGRKGSEGRSFLDVVTIRQILVLRDEKGLGEGEIERTLGLKRGVVERLGRRGVVVASETGMMG